MTYQLFPMLSISRARRRLSFSERDARKSEGENGMEFNDLVAWRLDDFEPSAADDVDAPVFSSLIFFALGCEPPEPEVDENMSMRVLCLFLPEVVGASFLFDASLVSETAVVATLVAEALFSLAPSLVCSVEAASRSSRYTTRSVSDIMVLIRAHC